MSSHLNGYGGVITTVGKDGFESKELVDHPRESKAYRIIDGQKVLFADYKEYQDQDYEAPTYTPEQNELYKQAMHSNQGHRLLNRLKNTSLIKRRQLRSIFETMGINPEFTDKIEKVFYPVKMQRRIDFRDEECIFNRIPLKDLGITKAQIMTLFINEGLIPNYGK